MLLNKNGANYKKKIRYKGFALGFLIK